MIPGGLSTVFIFQDAGQAAGQGDAAPGTRPSDPIPLARFMDLL